MWKVHFQQTLQSLFKESREEMGSGSSRQAVNMSGPVAEFVKQTIASDKIVIFSKSYCPYCKTAKEVNFKRVHRIKILKFIMTLFCVRVTLMLFLYQQFKKLNKAFKAIEIENRDDCSEIQAVLGEITGATSVRNLYFISEKETF